MNRHADLRDLSDDHHTALVLARRCRQSARPGASISIDAVWQLIQAAFTGQLEPHFRIEERHLLPALEEIGEAPLADRIRSDHAALRALAAAAAPDPRLIERFGGRLEAHVRFEEREVFEAVQHRLPSAALRAIAEACRSTPRTCPASLQP